MPIAHKACACVAAVAAAGLAVTCDSGRGGAPVSLVLTLSADPVTTGDEERISIQVEPADAVCTLSSKRLGDDASDDAGDDVPFAQATGAFRDASVVIEENRRLVVTCRAAGAAGADDAVAEVTVHARPRALAVSAFWDDDGGLVLEWQSEGARLGLCEVALIGNDNQTLFTTLDDEGSAVVAEPELRRGLGQLALRCRAVDVDDPAPSTANVPVFAGAPEDGGLAASDFARDGVANGIVLLDAIGSYGLDVALPSLRSFSGTLSAARSLAAPALETGGTLLVREVHAPVLRRLVRVDVVAGGVIDAPALARLDQLVFDDAGQDIDWPGVSECNSIRAFTSEPHRISLPSCTPSTVGLTGPIELDVSPPSTLTFLSAESPVPPVLLGVEDVTSMTITGDAVFPSLVHVGDAHFSGGGGVAAHVDVPLLRDVDTVLAINGEEDAVLSLPALVHTQRLSVASGATTTIEAPSLTSLGAFSAHDNASLTCDAITAFLCGLAATPVLDVADNAEPTCNFDRGACP